MRTCAFCSHPIPSKATGRPAHFCSEAHRRAAGRWRRRHAAMVRRAVLILRGKAGAPQDGDPLIAEVLASVAA